MNSIESIVVMASLLMQNDDKNSFDAADFASGADTVAAAVVFVGFAVATLLSSK